MVKGIVGYSQRKRNNFGLFILLAFLGLLFLFAIVFILSLGPEDKAAHPTKTTTTTIVPRHITSPAPSKTVEFTDGRVYFRNHLMLEKVPQKIKHLWIGPSGAQYASIDLVIVSQPADTWSYISLPPGSGGKWKVQAVMDGKVIAEENFTVE